MAAEIKICGIAAPDALEAAIKARAEYAGFVFYPPSPRNLAPKVAGDLARRAGDRIRRIGLFVDADDTLLNESVEAADLNGIQLHGSEPPARVAEVKARFGLPVWKALPVASSNDVAAAEKYEGAADLILFDARTPKGALPGGMGLAFDWSLLTAWRGRMFWGLAGGLTPDNVADALRRTKAPLVDTSSGVESAPGVKDVDRIAAFCKAARR
ncbi:phosphoribosylanthranilate isomerase [Altererythrobacter sp. SALINAS58]|uniref:phosphoribosylanthranilate isomerase n=1 Tax=Alteripontixanthobacter muriae TaxID=2705546 RepID=UPI001576502B|nr:phosphoribosylanthranilate isomerase [Alteripontixanthobacter muriae]NTZ42999.1 phosphoribosylanthranilate isomerase [Alteripontixanthobacter muriae]